MAGEMEHNRNMIEDLEMEPPAAGASEQTPIARPPAGDMAEPEVALAQPSRPPRARTQRHDGWTPERIRIFLFTLAQCGVVADAAKAAGMSVQGAYRLRNRAAGHAFDVAWSAAAMLGRKHLVDSAMSRALNGWIETTWRRGEIWGERNRFDNRLTMAMITRLDRQVENDGAENKAARTVAKDFDAFVELVCQGGEGVDAFIAARQPPEPAEVSPRRGYLTWLPPSDPIPSDAEDPVPIPADGHAPNPAEGAVPAAPADQATPVAEPIDTSHLYLDSIPGWDEKDALLCLRAGLFEKMDDRPKAQFMGHFAYLIEGDRR